MCPRKVHRSCATAASSGTQEITRSKESWFLLEDKRSVLNLRYKKEDIGRKILTGGPLHIFLAIIYFYLDQRNLDVIHSVSFSKRLKNTT